MAESGSGQEKTEEPTGKKLEQSRNEGQVPRSKELNTLLMLLAAGFAFVFMGGSIVSGLSDMLRESFVIDRALMFDKQLLAIKFWEKIKEGIGIMIPFFALMLFVAIASPIPMSGWVFSTKALQPKLDRMDPIKGLKNKIFSWKGLIELGKAFIKFLIVATVGYLLLQVKLPEFLALGGKTLDSALEHMAIELIWIFIILSSSLILVALVDIPFQLWDYKQQQKMTLQEVKDENKETEGSPEVKGKLRSKQRELAMARMMEEVPKADVVVTNPTHFAVALKYDQIKMSAPVVVALGSDLVALQIRRVADANDVLILESPALARSLYYNTDIGQEIPSGLYLAVAQVLAYVFQIKQYQRHGGVEPHSPTDLPIPEDLQRD